MKKVLVTAMTVATLSGCASVDMHSYVDPQFNSTQYSSLMVEAAVADLKMKTLIEERVCKQINLKLSTVKCIKAIDIFAPTREYDQQTWQQTFAKTGAQARLQIELLSQHKQTSHSTTTHTTPAYSSLSSSYSAPSTSYTTHNTTVHLTDKFQITLFDKGDQSKAMVTTGAVNAQKTMLDHNKTIASLISKHITKELINKGLVQQATPELK
ncbi:hypothetical protein [Pseudoalteromonas luteoviolacea]|uniref:Uncharacterized protein n=1 Tax=Pseudoalteromonas luteoviolacea H33 TaxID=1365251 RepID=A0A166ZRA0_9GAMM|nr:hypothetical protein [Pseudoalteromonas luteoviolacea]KZN44579.1 hypothetical protein N476_06150 [Pseudoalteromonas luteoviolacea H33]KZN75381.1 hypothetical protein N477_19160 [Pseudoalteromonas luteoviolacea H33-S]MBQ4879600.1 hypothetical protein [Pseudoalteromonas luteoviolacea]MBQ4908733.1 hypothetical protein [Pseudoalteromonas luteoviolacea]